jgi:hypothetical protein
LGVKAILELQLLLFAAAWLAIVIYLSHRVTHDYTPGIVVGVGSVAWFVWWALMDRTPFDESGADQ